MELKHTQPEYLGCFIHIDELSEFIDKFNDILNGDKTGYCNEDVITYVNFIDLKQVFGKLLTNDYMFLYYYYKAVIDIRGASKYQSRNVKDYIGEKM